MGKDRAGPASRSGFTPVINFPDMGGGMSASENRMVGKRGKIIYSGGGPKSTAGGKDLGKNAKNKIGGPAGLLTKEQGPTAWPQSRNRGRNYKGGKGSNKGGYK